MRTTHIHIVRPDEYAPSKRVEARSSAALPLILFFVGLIFMAVAADQQRRKSKPAPTVKTDEAQKRADRVKEAERRMRDTDEMLRRNPAKDEVG